MDWKQKLTSRKLWLAVAGLISGLCVAFGLSDNDVAQISGIVMSIASVIAYIVGEGLIDYSHKE